MLTVSQLAKRFSLSRTAVLYYERQGLLTSRRGDNGYRYYGDEAVRQLTQIVSYRSLGLSVNDIHKLLVEQQDRDRIVQQHFLRLEQEIQILRKQQQAIVSLLNYQHQEANEMINKEKWTDIMRAAGLSDDDMNKWHIQFERMEPEGHEEFLKSIGCSQEEVALIRQRSRADG